MFDLFRSREKSVRILLGVLLGLVALSMVTYLIPGGYGSSITGGGEPTVVATVGGEDLTARDVQMAVLNVTRNRGIPRGLEDYFVPQLMEQMVRERAMIYEAKRLGLEVTDEELANAVRSIVPADVLENRQMYQAYANQNGMTVAQYEDSIRKQMLLTKLRNMVAEGVVVAPEELKQEFHVRNDKVKIDYVAISPAKLKEQVKPTPAELQAYYNSHQAQFQTPEKRDLTLLVVDRNKVADTIQVTDADLKKAYNENADKYRTPERVQARHILIKTAGKPDSDAPKLEAKANDLLKQLKGGADFAKLAKENSEDPGSAAKGGDLGWFGRGQMVKNFETAAFSLKPGELSNVIRTEYGFHILQVTGKEEARLKPLDEVKGELTAQIKQQQAAAKVQQLADQAHDELAKNPAQADQIAQKLGIEAVKADNVGPGDPLPQVGVSGDLDNAVKTAAKGTVTPVIQVNGDKFAVAEVTAVHPAHAAPLAEVEDKVRQAVVDQGVQELVRKKTQEVLDKTKATGGDLKKVAQEMGLEYKTTPEFTRNGAAEGIGAASMVGEAFSKPVGTVLGPVAANGSSIIYRVDEKIPADPGRLDQEKQSLLDALKQKAAQQRTELFEAGVVQRLVEEKKIKINEEAQHRLIQALRG